jgi:hypothetical protein
MQHLSDKIVIKLLVETQAEYIKTNNIQPELFSFFDSDIIEKYHILLDTNIKNILETDDFIFEIKYDNKLKLIIFDIEIYGNKEKHLIDLDDIEDYIIKNYNI